MLKREAQLRREVKIQEREGKFVERYPGGDPVDGGRSTGGLSLSTRREPASPETKRKKRRLNARVDLSTGKRGRTLRKIISYGLSFSLHSGAWLRPVLLLCLSQLRAENPQSFAGLKGLSSV